MGRHDGLVRLARTQGDGRKVFLDETALVERSNQELERLLHGRIVGGCAGLVGEVFRKGGLARGRLHHVAAAFLVFLGITLRADLLVIALVPVLLHALEGVEIIVTQGQLTRPLLFRVIGGNGRVRTF